MNDSKCQNCSFSELKAAEFSSQEEEGGFVPGWTEGEQVLCWILSVALEAKKATVTNWFRNLRCQNEHFCAFLSRKFPYLGKLHL